MLAVDLFLVPGNPGEVVDVKIDVAVHTRYRNEVGAYAVQDGSGRVAGQLPGSPLYASAVLHGGGRQVLLPSGTLKSAAGELTVAAGTELAFYLIQNQSGQALLTRNPTNKLSGHAHAFFSAQGLSAHDIDHVRERTLADGRSVYAFEDQLHGGDRDYNDAVLTVTVIDTIHPTGPPKVSPPPAPTVPTPVPPHAPPTLTAALAHDTGMGVTDGITSDATVSGSVQGASPVTALSARLDGAGGFVNISDLLQEGGGFTLNTERIGQLSGGGLAEGVHTLELRAQDDQGSVSSVFTLTFAYDVTAPRLILSLDPAFAASPTSPATTNDATVTLVAASEPGALIALASPNLSMIADASGHAVFAGLPVALGSNAFAATATDAAGNVSAPSPLTVTRVAATAPPVVTAALADDTGTSPTDRVTRDDTVTGHVQDAATVAGLMARIDGIGAFTDESDLLRSDSGFTIIPGRLAQLAGGSLADGPHTLEIQARDESGQISNDDTLTFTLDTQPPTISVLSPSPGEAATTNVTVAGKVMDATSGVAGLQAGIDGDALFPVSLDAGGNYQFTTTLALDHGADGPHVVRLQAVDAAGNTSPSSSVDFTLNTLATAYTFAQTGGSAAAKATSTAAGPDDVIREGDSFSASLSNTFVVPAAPSSLQFDYSNLNFDQSDVGGIKDAFEVALVDPGGNTLVHTIVDGRDANFNVSEGRSAVTGVNTQLDGQTVKIDLSNVAPGTTATLVVRLVNNDRDGNTTVEVGPPRIVPGGLGTPNGSTPTVAVADAAQPTQSLHAEGLSDISGSVQVAYGRTSLAENPTELVAPIQLTDLSTATIAGPLILAIDLVSDPSVGLVRPSGFLDDGRPYLNLSGAIPSGGLGRGQTSGGSELIFSDPDGVQFTYRAVLLATLDQGPAAFTSTPVTAIQAGNSYRYQAAASDAQDLPLAYSIAVGPASMAVDPNTGVVTWTPTAADIGNQSITLRATDPHGLSVDQSFTVAVVQTLAGRPPLFTSTPPTDATVSSPYQVETYATGGNPLAVAAADFGTGSTSIVTANPGDQTLGLLGGSGNGAFGPTVPLGVGEPNPTLAQTSFVQPVTVNLGFSPGTYTNFERDVSDIVTADVNGDGIPDVVALVQIGTPGYLDNREVGKIGVRLGNGDGTFRQGWEATLPPVPGRTSQGSTVRVGDVTGDGKPDLIVSSYLGEQILVYTNNGDGTFADTPIASPTHGAISSMQVADLNGDGKLDVVGFENNVSGQFRSGVSTFFGDGAGHFGAEQFYPSADDNGGQGYAVDVDGKDGPDLVRLNYSDQRIEVQLNDGTGHFGAVQYSSVYAITNNGLDPMAHATDSPLSAYFGDFDRDGKIDAEVSTGTSGIFFLRGTGDGKFGDGTLSGNRANIPIYTSNGFENSPIAANGDGVPHDLNGDGIPDLVFGNNQVSQLFIGLGRGDGTFEQHFYNDAYSPDLGTGIVGQLQPTPQVNVADYNGDGVMDVLVGSQIRNDRIGGAAVVLGDRPGTLRTPGQVPFEVSPFSSGGTSPTVTADFNGDGIPDIATLNFSGVSVALGIGDGTFQPFNQAISVGGSGFLANSLIAADFNGDSKMDIAWLDRGGYQGSAGTRYIQALGLGDGTFQLMSIVPIPGGLTVGAETQMGGVVGDFNGDGHPDLAYRVSDGVSITSINVLLYDPVAKAFRLLPDPDGLLGPIPRRPGYYQDEAIGYGDLKGDGKMEIFVHSVRIPSDGTNPEVPERLTVFTPSGAPAATAAQLFTRTVIDSPGLSPNNPIRSYVVADFNRDGKPDLAAQTDYGATLVAFGRGDFTFHAPTSYATNSNSLVMAADVNGDGVLDLVSNWGQAFGNSSTRSLLSVLLGRPDGTFGPSEQLATIGIDPLTLSTADFNLDGKADLSTSNSQFDYQAFLATPPGLAAVAAGDLNGDGKTDLVALNTGFDRVKLLLGNGDNTFSRQADLFVGASPVDLKLADVDGDGKLDIVTANRIGQSVTVLRNSGEGKFSRTDYALPARPSRLAVGDLNGDGKPDLLTISELGQSLTVLPSVAGGFGAPITLALGFAPGGVVLADLDGDGKLDAVVTDPAGKRILILPGLGDGTFGTATILTLTSSPQDVAVADMNGDGKLDLIVTLPDDNRVAVLFGRGGDRFTTAQTISVGKTPSSLAVADVNGDGRPDLLVTNGGDNTLSVILNRFDTASVYRYTPTATDPDGYPVTFSVATAPGGLLYDDATGQILWAPTPEQIGPNAVEIRADDGHGGVATQGFTIQVSSPISSPTPVFTSTPVAAISAEGTFAYQPAASNPGGGPLRYSLVSGPAGMTVDPTTGAVTRDPRRNGLSLDVFRLDRGLSGRGSVETPDGAGLDSPSVTAEGWYKFDATFDLFNLLLGKKLLSDDGNSTATTWGIENYYGIPRAILGDKISPTTVISSPTPIVLGQWYHFALTFDDASRTLSFYVNGQLVGSSVVPTSLRYAAGPLLIGDAENLDATVSGVRIWNVARSGADIAADMLRDVPDTTPGLVLDYRFNESRDVSTVIDSSPFENNGSIVTDYDFFNYPARVPALGYEGSYPVTIRVDDGKGGVGTQTFNVSIVSPIRGSVAGTVFNDLNGNGTLDEGETGLAGWTVFIDANHDGNLDPGDARTVTDAQGQYTLAGLTATTLTIAVQPQAGAVSPAPRDVAIMAGAASTADLAVTLAQPGFIRGSVELAGTTTPVRGFVAYADLNHNGVLDADEPFSRTDAAGHYAISGLEAGTYTVRLASPDGWNVSTPAGGSYTVALPADGDVGGNDFSVTTQGGAASRPIFLSIPPLAATARSEYRYAAVASDPLGQSVIFSLAAGPDGMAVDPLTGVVVWTPTLAEIGPEHVLLRATNAGGGVAVQDFTIAVASPNTAPIVASAPPSLAFVGVPFRYDVAAQDAEQSTLTYSLLQAPDGMTIDAATGEIDWTPTAAQLGPQSVVVDVGDGVGGDVRQLFPLTVATAGPYHPPVFVSGPRPDAQVNRTYLGKVVATDPDGNPLTFSLVSGPQGLTVSSRGIVAWTPSAAEFGANSIRLQVSDGRGAVQMDYGIDVGSTLSNTAPVLAPVPITHLVAGQLLSIDLQAGDREGDPLAFGLASGPVGLSIDPARGTLRWIPGADQIGTHAVVVSVLDPFGGSAQETLTIVVGGSGGAVAIASVPPTAASVGRTYLYPVSARDSEGGPLAFSLLADPPGLTIDANTGVIAWTPTADEVGSQPVILKVSDGAGGFATQSFTVTVSAGAANLPPVVTSTPPSDAAVGSPLAYTLTATDPQGGALVFAVRSGPMGMTIDAATGQVSWTPSASDLGRNVVVLTATDTGGGIGVQSFEVDVRAMFHPPKITSTAPATVAAGALFSYDVIVDDPDRVPLSYRLISGPAGMTIDGLGRVRWQTQVSTPLGPQTATLIVSDGRGGVDTEAISFAVVADTVPPLVSINVTGGTLFPYSTEPALIRVRATDNVGVTSLVLMVDGRAVALAPDGTASVYFSAPGAGMLEAVASDAAGNVGHAFGHLNERSGLEDDSTNYSNAPTVAITSVADGDQVRGFVKVVGTAASPDLSEYVLSYRRYDETSFHPISQGNGPVTAGDLGTWDTTLLEDGPYVLHLEATDQSGNYSAVDLNVGVSGNFQLGNFRLTFADLTIPVAGIPITLARTYDSLQSGRNSELGYGWSLEFRDTNLAVSLPKSGQEDAGVYTPFRAGVKVYVTLPGGVRQGFTFTPDLKTLPGFGGPGLTVATPRFTPDKGVTGTLSVGGGSLLVDGSGNLFADGGLPWNPADPDFGGGYTLTTSDGTRFRIDGNTGLLDSETDAHGNALTFTDAGISGSDGTSLAFERDPSGRIVAAVDPMGLKITYTYDTAGDLIAVTDRDQATTTYSYSTAQAHYLVGVTDPLGRTGVRTLYDANGRLSGIVNDSGNAVGISYDTANSTQTVTDPLGHSTVTQYDDQGNVAATIDALGDVTHMTYDDSDNLLSVTDPLGETTSYTYDADGNPSTVTDPLGRVTHYTYGPHHTLLSTTDPLGDTTTNTYDASGNLATVADPAGVVIRTNTFDASGNLLTSTDASGGIASYAYNGRGQTTRITTTIGHSVNYVYDADGNLSSQTTSRTDASGAVVDMTISQVINADGKLTSVTDPSGHSLAFRYDAAKETTAIVDRSGNTISYAYDTAGRRVKTTYADGNTETSSFDAAGNTIRTTDRAGRATSYFYDALNRLIKTIAPDGSSTSRTYDAAGRVSSTTDADGNVTTNAYDAAGELVKLTDALGGVTSYAYDAAGRRISTTDPLGRTTQTRYDADGRPTAVIAADGSSETTTYDIKGQAVAVTDANGNVTRYGYDAIGRRTRVVDALGGVTTYAFDEMGDEVAQTDALGHITRQGFDDAQHLTSATLPGGETSTSTYDADGDLVSQTDADGQTTAYAYDVNHRLIHESFADSTSFTFTYTPTGQRASVLDASGLTTYTYDLSDRLAEVRQPDGQTISYRYDAAGNRTAIVTAAGTTSYTYDALNRISTVTDPAGLVTRYTYDGDGELTSTSLPDGSTEARTYDTTGRVATIETRDAGGFPILSEHYTYDAAGNEVEVDELGGRVVRYAYDALDRLTREAITDPSAVDRVIAYAYDAVGNRLSRVDSASGTTLDSYDADDRLVDEAINGVHTKSSYDADGHVLSKITDAVDQVLYHWDAQNHLSGVDVTTPAGTSHTTYRYDADGRRLAETTGGVETRSLVDVASADPQVLEQYRPDGSIVASYTYGDAPISQSGNGQTSVYHADALGSVRALTNLAGAVTDRFAYDAFGNLLAHQGSTRSFHLFAGENLDAATGLINLRARQYDPTLGRFTSVDPVGPNRADPTSIDRYTYTRDNPVNDLDPSGQYSLGEALATIAVIGILGNIAAIGTGAVITQAVFNGLSAGAFTTNPDALLVSVGGSINLGSAVLNYAPTSPITLGLSIGLVLFNGVGSVDLVFPHSKTPWVYGTLGFAFGGELGSNPLEKSPAALAASFGLVYNDKKVDDFTGTFVSTSASLGRFSSVPAPATIFTSPFTGGTYGFFVTAAPTENIAYFAADTYSVLLFDDGRFNGVGPIVNATLGDFESVGREVLKGFQ